MYRVDNGCAGEKQAAFTTTRIIKLERRLGYVWRFQKKGESKLKVNKTTSKDLTVKANKAGRIKGGWPTIGGLCPNAKS